MTGGPVRCAGHIWIDLSRTRPNKKGTVKQWQPGRRCRAYPKAGSDYCAQHQDQDRPRGPVAPFEKDRVWS